MRRTWAWPVLAVGGLVLLASLYLPWLEPGRPSQPGDVLNLFDQRSIDGWGTRVGDAAGLADLLLIGLAVLALLRPSLEHRLPLSSAALLAFYLTIAVGAQARSTADVTERVQRGLHYHYAYGAYVGVAAAAVAVLGAVARWKTPERVDLLQVLASVATIALLVSILLPWAGSPLIPVTVRGIEAPAAAAAAATSIWLLGRWWGKRDLGLLRLGCSTALLAGAAFGLSALPEYRRYGAWIGLGCGLALVPLALAARPPLVRPRLRALDAATSAAAALLIAGLFLPWQTYCYGKAPDFRELSGRCVSSDGWSTLGTAAAGLTIVVFVLPLLRRRVAPIELAAAIALLVATAGFGLVETQSLGLRQERGYGSTIGFAAAAAILLLVLVRLRLHRVRSRTLVPLGVCVAYLVVVVLPWWGVLSLDAEDALRFADPSWLTIAGVVLAVHLARLWARADPAPPSQLVVLWPLGLLALSAVDLIRLRDGAFTWGEGLVASFCLVLVACGWVEYRHGLEAAGLPAVLRVDRI